MKQFLSAQTTIILAAVFALTALVMSCATPTQPTGGPQDQTPPRIIETEPQNGTVNFSGDEVRFHFDKYVNRESFANAFRISPLVGIRYELSWRGRSVRVRFDEPLPDTTTVIFTIGTEFSDTNRNRITQPFVLALSTGDTIDEGEIQGKVLDARTGRGKQDAFVFLYREPFDLESQADYVAETDTSGAVNFTYLRKGRYKALWVDDRNRNNRWNQSNEAARPFYKEFVDVTLSGPADLGVMYVNEPDTTRPQLQGTGMFSSQRLRLRYSRDMTIQPGASVSITDSLGNTVSEAIPLYVDKEQQNVIFAHSRTPLSDEGMRYRTSTNGITDIHGNAPRSSSPSFSGSTQSDTTRVRLIRHLTEDGVLQDEPFVFEFSTLIAGTSAVDSLEVIRDETIFESWEPIEVEDNLLYVFPADIWEESSDYTIRIFNELSGSYSNISTTVFPRSRMGSLRVSIDEEQRIPGVTHYISVKDRNDLVVFEGQTEDELLIDNLVPGHHTIIAFRDDDGEGSWFRGDAQPFRAAEPYVVNRGIEIHSRMEGEFQLRYPFAPETGLEPVEVTDVEIEEQDDSPEVETIPDPEP
ncbi:MAG: Ig-like domain-containing protein [Balneolia bacterium]|nr:Ig-like domain-containing protein [Balneolia bacterium]